MQVFRLPTTESPTANDAPNRAAPNLSGLNWLRVAAAFGVVWLHACVPYLRRPMPGLGWPVTERASDPLDFSFWAVEVFIMPVFLVIAGVLAWQSLQRHGASSLVKGRIKRLGKPLLFGLCVILPIDLYVWLAGWVYEGWIDPVKLRSLKIDGPLGDNLWGTSHLWFLLYLLTYIAALAGATYVTDTRIASKQIIRRLSSVKGLIPMTLVLVGIVTLCFRPNVVWGFQHAFVPVPSKWIYSATFFFGGVWLSLRPSRLEWLVGATPRLAGLAIVLLMATVVQGQWQLEQHDPQTAMAELVGTVLAVLTTVSAWTVTLATMGVALRISTRTPAAVSYLAAASFWIYLVHHPLLGLIHIDLKYLMPDVASGVKGPLSFAIAVGAALLTYESFVRKTRLGTWLGMGWSARSSQPAATVLPMPETTTGEEQRVAA